MTQDLPRLPTMPEVMEVQQALIQADKGKTPGVSAVELLKSTPGLARMDAQWHALYPTTRPTILRAIDYKNIPYVRLCLQHGSAPYAATDGTGKTLMQYMLEKSTCDNGSITMLEALLEHPESHRIDIVDSSGKLMLFHARNMMSGADDKPELNLRRIAAYCELIRRTPAELLAEKTCLAECIRVSDRFPAAVSEEDTIAIIRMLADRGADLASMANMKENFDPLLIMSSYDQPDAAAALLAAGVDVTGSGPYSVGATFRSLKISAAAKQGGEKERRFIRRMEQGCAKILDEQIARITVKHEPPEQVLFTPEGRPSWQAQGLVMRGRVSELFDARHAALFGGVEQQFDFSIRLHEALPERQRGHFNLPGKLREDELARPEDTAVVRYVRAQSVFAGKGAA